MTSIPEMGPLPKSKYQIPSKYEMKDSGQRQEFPTGAVRDTQSGKGRYDLLPVVALKRVAAVYEKGAQKYSDHNWTLGIPASRFMDSALRHLMQYSEGHRDEDHLAQAAFNVLGLIHTESMVERGNLPASLMDLPSYVAELPMETAWRDVYGILWPSPIECDRWRDTHPAGTAVPVRQRGAELYADMVVINGSRSDA